jgi:hypothetical protein
MRVKGEMLKINATEHPRIPKNTKAWIRTFKGLHGSGPFPYPHDNERRVFICLFNHAVFANSTENV